MRLTAALPFPETKINLDNGFRSRPNRSFSNGRGSSDPNGGNVIAEFHTAVSAKRITSVAESRLCGVQTARKFGDDLTRDSDRTRGDPENHLKRLERPLLFQANRISHRFAVCLGRVGPLGLWKADSAGTATYLPRLDEVFQCRDPNPEQTRRVPGFNGRAVPFINITNVFSGPSAEVLELNNR
jgi:hypothetical protein